MKRTGVLVPVLLCLLLTAGLTLAASSAPESIAPVAVSPTGAAAGSGAPSIALEPVEAEQALLGVGDITAQAIECLYCPEEVECTGLRQECNSALGCRCNYCNGFLGCFGG